MQSNSVRRVLVGAVLGAVVAVAAPATASAQVGQEERRDERPRHDPDAPHDRGGALLSYNFV